MFNAFAGVDLRRRARLVGMSHFRKFPNGVFVLVKIHRVFEWQASGCLTIVHTQNKYKHKAKCLLFSIVLFYPGIGNFSKTEGFTNHMNLVSLLLYAYCN